jgi:hypothetical protein
MEAIINAFCELTSRPLELILQKKIGASEYGLLKNTYHRNKKRSFTCNINITFHIEAIHVLCK